MPEQPKKLHDPVRDALRIRHNSYRTEQSYVYKNLNPTADRNPHPTLFGRSLEFSGAAAVPWMRLLGGALALADRGSHR